MRAGAVTCEPTVTVLMDVVVAVSVAVEVVKMYATFISHSSSHNPTTHSGNLQIGVAASTVVVCLSVMVFLTVLVFTGAVAVEVTILVEDLVKVMVVYSQVERVMVLAV